MRREYKKSSFTFEKINFSMIFVFLVIFFFMLTLNSYTPYVADDFNNMFTQDSYRVHSIMEVFANQQYRYNNTNGRTVAHTIAGVVLMMDKYLINILNSLVFCLFIYIMYNYSKLHDYFGINIEQKNYKRLIQKNKYGRNGYKTLYILFIFLSLWYFTPVFGQNFLWVIGSANYLWTNVIILTILLVVRRTAILKVPLNNVIMTLIFILLSFFSGWTNENSVPAILVLIFYYLLVMKKHKTDGILFIVMMLISMITGFVVMLTAPGNFIRASYFEKGGTLFEKISDRMVGMNEKFVEYFFVLLLIAIVAAIISRVFYLYKNFESEAFIVGALVSYYSMLLSPTFPLRAGISTVYLLLISIVMSLSVIGRVNVRAGSGVILCLLLFLGYMFYDTVPSAMIANKEYFGKYSAREMIIIDSKTFGKVENIEIPPVTTENKYVAAYGLEDAKYDKDDWINYAISRYYGVKSVILQNQERNK